MFFAHKQTLSDFLERNPQYQIPKPETIAVPASTPKWVEDMLDRGRTELVKQLGAIPDSAKNAVITLNYKSELKCLENWRNINNVLVLQSDKNLGTIVVCAEWYNKKLDTLVLDDSDFTEIIDYRGKFIPIFNEIRKCENKYLPQEVKDFILASCNIEDVKLPRFHGLPKIHKKPWALRPIVPCYSYPLANASKVLFHFLKLRVRESRWILESSQELARLLEGIRIPSGKKYWLCKGDVVAMYPNIPRARANQILGEIARDACSKPNYVNLITKLAQWSDNYLVFEHKGRYFHQKEGHAMGIPTAPDVANLYMSHFEDSFANKFLIYTHYIDDVFCLVEADSKKQLWSNAPKSTRTA